MAFNTPKFNTPNPPFETPLVVTTNFGAFVGAKGFLQQRERAIKGQYKNYGFVNAAFEALMRQKDIGWEEGRMWCAYFVKIVYMQMYSFDRDWIAKNITGSSNGNLKTVTRFNKAGDNKYLAIYTDTPQVADIFVQEIGNTGKGHTGIITEVLGKNADGSVKVKTLEGNTSLAGVREGQGVFSLTRNLKIGTKSGGESKFMRGYIRRNFSQTEIDNLVFDNKEQTFKFKSQTQQNVFSPFRFLPKQ